MAFRCVVCDVKFDKCNHFKRHLETKKHKINDTFQKLSEKTVDGEQVHETCIGSTGPYDGDGHVNDHDFCVSDSDAEIQDDDGVEELGGAYTNTTQIRGSNDEWFPFPSKLSLLLYGLLHSPTHHISLEVAKYVWFILREVGVPNIPPINQVRNMKFGDLNVEDLIIKGEDDSGLPLYIIKPSEIAKLNMSNPTISPNIARYPRKTTVIKEQRDGTRLREIISPWASVNNIHFHVGEPVKITNNALAGVIRAFYESDENVLAEIKIAEGDRNYVNDDNSLMERSRLVTVPLTSLSKDVEPSVMNDSITTSGQLVEKPKEIPKVSIPVNLFIDDTSTNVSKRWQPMHCAQMQLAGVPLQFRNNEIYSNFLGASEHASVLSISKLILQDIESTQQNPVETFDADMKTCIEIKMEVASLIADFNMLSLACNHAGATALKFCPKCHADRDTCSSKERERFPQETVRTIERLRLRGTEQSKKSLKKQTGVKDYDNPFWEVLNPHRDIPSGVLHLFHLGTSKHLLKVCIESLSENKVSVLESHLSGLDSQQQITFNICKNLNSRQGKDLKKFIQVAPFSLAFAGLNTVYLKMTCLLALINRMVCKDSFDDEDIQLLDNLVKKYLQIVEEHLPQLKNKVKTHLLTHLTDEISRHGPPLGYSEDVFEKRHGLIRAKLFNQENQLARSRDTAILFGKSCVFLHVLMGGFFQTNDATWTQSTKSVQELAQRKEMIDFLGHLSTKDPNYESHMPVLLMPIRCNNKKAILQELSSFHPQCLLLQGLVDLGTPSPTVDGKMITYQGCRSQDGSVIKEGMSLAYMNRENEVEIGLFKRGYLILLENQRKSLITVEKGHIQTTSFLGCPIVHLKNETDVVPLHRVLSYVPLVHHCAQSHCTIREGRTTIRVEQEDKDVYKRFLVHNMNHAIRVYVVNVFSLKCPSEFPFSDLKTCSKKL
nr:uncharacterized protein LOC117683581 isoform X2 [Crassostrea gigas]